MSADSDNGHTPTSSELRRRFREESFDFHRARAQLPGVTGVADAVGSTPDAPLPRARLQPDFVANASGYHVRELLRFHHGALIEACYRAILLRGPDPEGLHHAETFLERGGSKIRFIGGLRYSEEGQAKGVPVAGLRWRYLVEQAYRIPVLGLLLEIAAGIVRLPVAARHHRALEFYSAGQIASVEAAANQATEIVRHEVSNLGNALRASLDGQAARLLQHEARLSSQGGHIETVVADLEGMHGALAEFDTRQRTLEASGARLAQLLQLENLAVEDVRSALAALAERFQTNDSEVKSQLNALAEQLRVTEAQAKSGLGALLERFQANENLVRLRLGALGERFAINETGVQSLKLQISNAQVVQAQLQAVLDEQAGSVVPNLDARLLRLNDEFGAVARELPQMKAMLDEQAGSVVPNLDARLQRLNDELGAVAGELPQVKAGVAELHEGVERVGGAIPELKAGVTALSGEIEWIKGAGTREAARTREMDPFYIAFEDRFRGSREDIRARVAEYLPLVKEVEVLSAQSPLLDLGCGRGEWLELLRDQGLPARGVDLNGISVADCRARGLDVDEADVLAFLKSLADESLGAVTSMHLVEHLPFQMLLDMLAECRRSLKSGGLLILETPNPANVLVGSNTFYLDPTHRNPIPSALLQFTVESAGFANVTVIDLHPSSHQWSDVRSEMDRYLIQNLFGAQDYAVVGHKP